MAKFRLVILAILLASLFSTMAPAAGAQIPPDDIKSYTVTVEPQPDGALKMKYDFSYCAVTDFPSDQQHLWIGVPNSSFELLDYGPKDWVVSANSRGSASQVELNFAHLPKAGECFSLTFTIQQHRMAYPTGDQVSFEFTPGWFDFARIDELKINWRLPDDAKLIKLLDPAPTKQGDGVATWVATNLGVNQKFTVKVLVDKAAFGVLAEPTSATPPPADSGNGSPLGTILIVLVVIFAAVLLIAFLLAWFNGDGGGGDTYPTTRRGTTRDSSYIGGGYIGGYHSSPSSPSSSSSSSSRSGGGSGSFGSRGSSCACVSSCACACACASGGRVGCSEKGYDISCLLLKKKE